MDWQQIASSVIIPAAVSFGIGAYNYQRQKRLEFSYDYKRYILEKRKKAYDEVETIISKMKGVTLGFRKNEEVKETWASVVESTYHRSLLVWLTDDLQDKLHATVEGFMDTVNGRQIGETPTEGFVQMIMDLEKGYLNDLVTLDNIDAFVKKNRIIESLPFTKSAGENPHATE